VRLQECRSGSLSLTLYDFEPPPSRLCEDASEGLSSSPKRIPPKYFYDEVGAQLFERITRLDAYYLTRVETSILKMNAAEIGRRIGESARLVEFGSGSGEKTRIVLRHLSRPDSYIPVDISRAQLVEFALRVATEFPELDVTPVCADFTAGFELPPRPVGINRTVAFFPGSSLGNFEPGEAAAFLAGVRRLVGPDGALLLGLDLKKDADLLERAYNDPGGVTARFNLNLLRRINRECGADFDLRRFHHLAGYDAEAGRIEMKLVSGAEQIVRFEGGGPAGPPATVFRFAAGESISTEYSHKYDLDTVGTMLQNAGWRIDRVWTDPDRWFAVLLLR